MRNIPNFEEYDERSETVLEGMHSKRFVRMDSSFFADMFKEIKNNDNSTYFTYLNEFIRENQKAETPCIERTSVLLKDITSFIKTAKYSETACSKLANALQVPVVYNKYFKDRHDKKLIASVDFIPKDCRFINLFDIIKEERKLRYDCITPDIPFKKLNRYHVVPYKIPLKELVSVLDDCLNSDILPNLINEDREEIIRQFVRQMLFRRFILADVDCKVGNFGLLYNQKTGRYKLAPCFDMELGFFGEWEDTRKEVLAKDFDFMMKQFPHEIYRLLGNVKKINNEKTLQNLFYDDIDERKYINKFVNRSKEFMDNFVNMCQNLEGNREMD